VVGGGQHLSAPMQLQFLPSNFQSFFQIPLFTLHPTDKALLAKILDLTLHFIPYTKSVGAGRVARKF